MPLTDQQILDALPPEVNSEFKQRSNYIARLNARIQTLLDGLIVHARAAASQMLDGGMERGGTLLTEALDEIEDMRSEREKMNAEWETRWAQEVIKLEQRERQMENDASAAGAVQ